jgi:hypothetical protein
MFDWLEGFQPGHHLMMLKQIDITVNGASFRGLGTLPPRDAES